MKPHKHAELIKAWADGAEIEYRSFETIEWKPIFKGWSWDNTLVAEYRIKPEPKPDHVFYGRVAFTYFDTPPTVGGLGLLHGDLDNLKLVFDGYTGELKSAEVL